MGQCRAVNDGWKILEFSCAGPPASISASHCWPKRCSIRAHVKDKYNYYAMIYGFPVQLYRNDYAFSIAVHMLSGFTHCDDIATLPSPFLFTSFDCDELIDIPSKNDLTFLLNDRRETWRFTVTRTKGISVHVMNKFAISGRPRNCSPCMVRHENIQAATRLPHVRAESSP